MYSCFSASGLVSSKRSTHSPFRCSAIPKLTNMACNTDFSYIPHAFDDCDEGNTSTWLILLQSLECPAQQSSSDMHTVYRQSSSLLSRRCMPCCGCCAESIDASLLLSGLAVGHEDKRGDTAYENKYSIIRVTQSICILL